MSSEHGQTPLFATKFRVLVTDLASVQRVLMMLCGRSYEPTRFEAEEAGSGRWRVGFDTCTTDRGAGLLTARLHRQIGVLDVEHESAGVLAVSTRTRDGSAPAAALISRLLSLDSPSILNGSVEG